MGVASLILGIIGLLVSLSWFKDLSLILSVVGLVLGIIAIIKKKNKGMGIAGVILTILSIIILFATPTETNITSTNAEKENVQETKTYGLNDIVTITTKSGEKYEIQITNITEMTERNQFSDINPAQVFLIDYTYTNITGEDLYISDMNFEIIDELGEMGGTYPNSITKYPKSTPAGVTCKAQMILYTNNKSNSITLTYKDNMFNDNVDLKFIINI